MDTMACFLKGMRRLWRAAQSFGSGRGKGTELYEEYVEFFDQEANDLVRGRLSEGTPCLVAKFGAVELRALVNYWSICQEQYGLRDLLNFVRGKREFLWWDDSLRWLCTNAGFFPFEPEGFYRFCDLYIEDMQEIDILGSYIREEGCFWPLLKQAARVNLDGYYAPYFFANPWTKVLEGKKVLVVHPFEESIRKQYDLRDKLWHDPNVLPEFELKTVRAVQTIAGEKSQYEDWFQALAAMMDIISGVNFDIALIGCGAYGLPLAAHVKRMGKQAVHLAGWTQVLFGIKGKRWIDNPRVAPFMNEYWSHPLPSEVPKNYTVIESGCYW